MHRTALALVLTLVTTSTALAVPTEVSHQGRLMDALGSPLTGSQDLTFSFYENAAGGVAIWDETVSVTLDDGYYSVILGETDPILGDDIDIDEVYLGLKVGTNPELPTRTKLTSVPYALVADSAETAVNVDGGSVDATSIMVDGTTVIDSSGNIDWSVISGAPTTLGDLTCSTDQVARWSGSAWACADDDDHAHDAADITTGKIDINRIPIGTGSGDAAAGDHAHSPTGVNALSCGEGEMPVWDDSSSSWACGGAGGGNGSLLASFELDETTGASFADDSGYNNPAAAPSGGIAAGATGHSGNGIGFLGGVATIPSGNSIPDSPRVTVEAWVEPAAPVTGTRTILLKEGAYALRQIDGAVTFEVSTENATCTATSATTVAVGSWSHVQGWYNGAEAVVSLDGVLSREPCTTGPVRGNAGTPVHIGADASSGAVADDYKGTIDEVRIWGTATSRRVGRNYVYCDGDNYGDYATTGHRDNTDINFECTITTTGRPVKMEYCMGFQVGGGANGGIYQRIWRNDAAYDSSPSYWQYNNPNDALHGNNCNFAVYNLPAGTHKMELRPYLHSCGSCTYYIRTTHMYLEEL